VNCTGIKAADFTNGLTHKEEKKLFKKLRDAHIPPPWSNDNNSQRPAQKIGAGACNT